jgi:DNA mismatch repair ATPase MutS
LSGPNGGGKSSFLRGLLQTILFSQSFGYAIGDSIHYSPFDYIFSGLHLQDIPGQKSLFEKEVCFARDILYYNNPAYKGLVLFDEIFHSTNPPDGIRTANEFLNKLYTYNHVASIISTHVFEIIEQSPSFVKKICVNAHRENNILYYDYKISNGICKESSVTEIWKKNYEDISAEQ